MSYKPRWPPLSISTSVLFAQFQWFSRSNSNYDVVKSTPTRRRSRIKRHLSLISSKLYILTCHSGRIRSHVVGLRLRSEVLFRQELSSITLTFKYLIFTFMEVQLGVKALSVIYLAISIPVIFTYIIKDCYLLIVTVLRRSKMMKNTNNKS